MTPKDLARFRTRLEQEQAAITAQIADLQQRVEGANENNDQAEDYGDEAQTAVQQEETLIEMDVLRNTLYQIEKALERLDDGTYGISEVSGKPIPIERLEVLPYATTLVADKKTNVPLRRNAPDFSVACLEFGNGIVAIVLSLLMGGEMDRPKEDDMSEERMLRALMDAQGRG